MTLDVSRLTPADAVAALRSFPRRFRSALALVDEEDDGVLHRAGPDGRSAIDHADLAVRDLSLLAEGVLRTLRDDRPTLHPSVLDEAARDGDGPDLPVDAVLDRLTAEAEDLAGAIEHVGADEWGRPALVGHRDVTAIDLLREAIRTTAGHLAALQRARSA